jgi:hypothetical protein
MTLPGAGILSRSAVTASNMTSFLTI